MTCIGIDPGYDRVGVGILQKNGSSISLVYKNLISTNRDLLFYDRLKVIYTELNEIVNEFKPDVASIEKLYFAKNTKTALSVSEARGVILLSLRLNGLDIYEYTPMQIKKGLTGYAKADKSQIQKMTMMILGLKKMPEPDDVADAIAISLTHLNCAKAEISSRVIKS